MTGRVDNKQNKAFKQVQKEERIAAKLIKGDAKCICPQKLAQTIPWCQTCDMQWTHLKYIGNTSKQGVHIPTSVKAVEEGTFTEYYVCQHYMKSMVLTTTTAQIHITDKACP